MFSCFHYPLLLLLATMSSLVQRLFAYGVKLGEVGLDRESYFVATKRMGAPSRAFSRKSLTHVLMFRTAVPLVLSKQMIAPIADR